MAKSKGAVDFKECPYYLARKAWKCRCGSCDVCGFHKHTAIHGPLYGGSVGSAPWGHEFRPSNARAMHRDAPKENCP
jgi:hypothetical protein